MASAHHFMEETRRSRSAVMSIPLTSSPKISLLNSVQPPMSPMSSPMSIDRSEQQPSSRELQRGVAEAFPPYLVESTRPETGLKAIGTAVQWQIMPVGGRHSLSSSEGEPVDEYSYTLLACSRCEPCDQCRAPLVDEGLASASTGGSMSGSVHRGRISSTQSFRSPTVLQNLRKMYRRGVRLCLGGEFVIDPRTTRMQLFDALIWALAIVYGALVPYEVAFLDFHHYKRWRYLWFERFADTIFMTDMVFQFFTMYFDNASMRWIRRPRAIAHRYLQTLFVFDVFANLPIDAMHCIASVCACWAHSFTNSGFFSEEVLLRTMYLFKLLRLTRINRAKTLYLHFRIWYGITSAQTQVPQFLVMCGYAAHILACTWGMTGRYGKKLGAAKTWVQAMNENKGDDVAVSSAFRLYSRSLYWSVATVTGNGYGDIVPVNDFEYVVVIIGMMIAGFVWAYAIGTICGIIAALDQQRMDFEFRMDRLESMMNEQELDSNLKRQLRRYCGHQAESVQMRQDLNLLRMMSPGLHARIAKHQIGRWLEQVPYMQDIAESNQVVMYIRSEVCSFVCNPTEVIELPQALCQLRRGLILKACRIYCRGTVWGHHDVLLNDIALFDKETPVALTFSEVLYLPKRAIDMLEEHFPRARQRIRRARVRSAYLRYFLNLGRECRGRKLVERQDFRDAVTAAQQEESTQSKLQRLQMQFNKMNEKLDEVLEATTEPTSPHSMQSIPKSSTSEHPNYGRKRSNIREVFTNTLGRSRDSFISRRQLYGSWLHAGRSASEIMDDDVDVDENAEEGYADDDEPQSPTFTVKKREDNGEFLPADIDEACDRGSILRGPPEDVDIVREVSVYEVQCVGSPQHVPSNLDGSSSHSHFTNFDTATIGEIADVSPTYTSSPSLPLPREELAPTLRRDTRTSSPKSGVKFDRSNSKDSSSEPDKIKSSVSFKESGWDESRTRTSTHTSLAWSEVRSVERDRLIRTMSQRYADA